MKRAESPPESLADFPPVIWQTSIPYSWKHIFARKKQSKSRPMTSKSVRAMKDTQQTFDGLEKPYPTLDHLYYPSNETLSSSGVKTQGSPRSGGSVFYTTKYLGITNGEIGILSQRKLLTPSQGSRRPLSQGRPHTQQMSRNSTTKDLLPGSPKHSQSPTGDLPTKEILPTEFLRPNPDRYDEFLIHTYTRPHPLTPVKNESAKVKRKKAPMFLSVDTMRYERAATTVKPAKLERRGVSGWKLTKPKSRSAAGSARSKPLKQAQQSEPTLVKTVQMMGWKANRKNEAYLQYLQIKNQLKE